jgi:oxalate decarboxylase/phosphoglucose isomerase-like protein (cupin superfamily)
MGTTPDALKAVKRANLAFREDDFDTSGSGRRIENIQWDNNYERLHQEPRNPAPNSDENNVKDGNYVVDFQRGWFLDAKAIEPVRYLNAMMDPNNPDRREGNIVEMRWIVQRELGGSLVFFHEVTIPPGVVEGTHRHIGTEELYYITEGTGIAYMGDGDDPSLEGMPLVKRHIYGYNEERDVRELRVKAGNVIFTKSGGIHGIRNDGTEPLKFVAFLYHTS